MPWPKGVTGRGLWVEGMSRGGAERGSNSLVSALCPPLSNLSRSSPAFARDAHQDADGEPAREHERAAVAEEGQRDAGDRHEVDRHADVLEHVNEPTREETKGDQTTE